MRVACLQDNGINESIAVADLSAWLKARGHEFDVFLWDEEPDLKSSLTAFRPDVFLVPGDLGAHRRFRRMTGWLKEQFTLPVVGAGIYPTLYQDDCLDEPHLDCFIIGEAEVPFLEYLRRLDAGQDHTDIPGIAGRRRTTGGLGGEVFRNPAGKPVEDLAEIGVSDREVYYKYAFIRDLPWKRFASSRGCAYQCSYCWNPVLQAAYPKGTKYMRRKPVDMMLEEIRRVRAVAHLKTIHFSDDLFVTKREWLEEFAEKFPREFPQGFTCNTTFEGLSDWAIDLLAQAGCRYIAMALESGDDALRKDVLQRGFTAEKAQRTAEMLRTRGIRLVTFNMVGYPGETPETSVGMLELNRRMRPYHSWLTPTQAFPDTKILQKAIERGAMTREMATSKEISDFSEGFNLHRNGRDYFNFFHLFPLLLKLPIPARWARSVFSWPRIPFFPVLQLLALWRELNFCGIQPWDALTYYLHGRKALPRTKNFVTLV